MRWGKKRCNYFIETYIKADLKAMKSKLNLLRFNQENDIMMGCETFFLPARIHFLLTWLPCINLMKQWYSTTAWPLVRGIYVKGTASFSLTLDTRAGLFKAGLR